MMALLQHLNRRRRLLLTLIVLGLIAFSCWGQAQETSQPVLAIHEPLDHGWIRLQATGPTNQVYHLETSSNLLDWIPLAATHDALVAYPDARSTQFTRRFYRLFLSAKTDTNDWKNQIFFPQDAFLSPQIGLGLDEIRWVKFAILLSDPGRVFYQNSREFLFHYDFATQHLGPFLGLTPAQFDQVSLYIQNQQVLLGTVLYPPPPNSAEFGIQLVGLDPYPAEMVRQCFDLVRATVVSSNGVQAFYIPTFEQSRAAETNRDYLAEHGIEVSSTGRWLSGSQCYASGWAVGYLKFFPGTEIDQAFADGRLQPGDILLTDTVPSEIPFLAGVICLEPSTPNSHVAILSRSYGIPFVYLIDSAERLRVQGLDGRKIALRATALFERCDIRVIDLEGVLTLELETEILDLKGPPDVHITPKAPYGALSASTENLVPADIQYFGGKAANYGLLRRQIPNNAPVAIAFSFDLWDQFLDQIITNDLSLRTVVSNRLSGYGYPPDVAALQTDLADIRNLITRAASFTPPQEQAIINALSPFNPAQNIRFRSSSNLEDTEHVTAAGIFDSYSGCLLDDLDGDAIGPSHCDPSENNERGVFRAIKKVYASFYNNNAVLERLRLGIDENQVGMALLVHHSFPDDIELANGVATLDVTTSATAPRLNGDLVTQDGAVPVTNPDGSALPEVVNVYRASFGTYLNLKQRSSLIPLGSYVLDWQEEYRAFVDLFTLVAQGYAQQFPAKQRFLLDFEYKKIMPDDLVVKQVRELPLGSTTNKIIPFLLNESNRFGVFQGEFGDVFANHRLKSRWSFQTRSLRLAETNLTQSFYTDASWDYIEGTQILSLTGPPSSWNEARHSVDGETISDGWSLGTGSNQRDFQLITVIRREVSASDHPLFTLADFILQLQVHYATPQPGLYYDGTPILVTNEVVQLVPGTSLTPGSLHQERTVATNGVSVQTAFWWPPPPTGVVAGYTAPLIQWVETTITGLTAEPIVLHGDFSQTYRPGHHNFSEEFIFEPRLEPGLSPSILSELQTKNIRLLHVVWGGYGPPLRILTLDGKFQNL